MTTRPRGERRRIYAVDVGTTLPDKHGQPRFGWACVDPELPEGISGSSSIELLSARLVEDLTAGHSIALGFEAPLFIPVPNASSDLSRGRKNEGSPSWAAPPGLTVASLGLHQAAWILRSIAGGCVSPVDFRLAPTAWPPTTRATTLFCWEAFVSGAAHSSSHIQDAGDSNHGVCGPGAWLGRGHDGDRGEPAIAHRRGGALERPCCRPRSTSYTNGRAETCHTVSRERAPRSPGWQFPAPDSVVPTGPSLGARRL